MSYSKKIDCRDCGQWVLNLKQHRAECPNSRQNKGNRGASNMGGNRGGSTLSQDRPGQVKCYDCQAFVTDLKSHRAQCSNSRVTKSTISVPHPSEREITIAPPKGIDFYTLLDVSGSMLGQKLQTSKNCISTFFDQMDENDRLAIVTFDTKAFFKLKPRPVWQLRKNNELPEILSRIFAQGGTALYDAIYISIEQIKDKNKKTILVVATDGEDNSSKHNFAEVLALLSEYPALSLHIIHVSPSGNTRVDQYAQLCASRGEYVVASEATFYEVSIQICVRAYQLGRASME